MSQVVLLLSLSRSSPNFLFYIRRAHTAFILLLGVQRENISMYLKLCIMWCGVLCCLLPPSLFAIFFFSSSAVVVAAAFVVVVRSTRANVMLLFNGRQMNLNGLLLCAVSREDVCRGKERESV